MLNHEDDRASMAGKGLDLTSKWLALNLTAASKCAFG